jgi:hypothetical protein
MRREYLIGEIETHLTRLRVSISHRNSLNLQDLNIHAEFFFRDFLNLAYDRNYKNTNFNTKNAAGIDLGDQDARIAIQVTSTNTLNKVKSTYTAFCKENLCEKYDELFVLIIGEKAKYRTKHLNNDSCFTFDTKKHVLDIKDLLKTINDLPLEKIESCYKFLERELPTKSRSRESNEVSTLIRVIEVLSSSDSILPSTDIREDPDPSGKINDRFANHADFLKSQYVNLHEIYSQSLQEVIKQSDMSPVKVKKMQLHLNRWSDDVLNEKGGNPREALKFLTNSLSKKMGANGAPYDEGAVQYYLIDQLISCNVFPNKVPQDA